MSFQGKILANLEGDEPAAVTQSKTAITKRREMFIRNLIARDAHRYKIVTLYLNDKLSMTILKNK